MCVAIHRLVEFGMMMRRLLVRLLSATHPTGLVQANMSAVDDSGAWTEQDQLDLTAFSLQYAVTDLD
jgi:hypothetical protein